MKTIYFTFLSWDIVVSFRARRAWNSTIYSKREGYRHFVWSRLSILIENWKLEIHAVCAECGSADIGEQGSGDEYLTVCGSCRSIEQGYRYVNLREYEKAS